jgi:hypothetical protein
VPGCQEPPPDVFAKTGIDAEFAQSTFGKVIVGTVKVKTQPEVVSLLSQAVSDSRVRDYLRCLAINRDHYTIQQAAHVDAVNAFLATKPSSGEFGRWQELHPFPSSTPPVPASASDLPELPSSDAPCVHVGSTRVLDFRSVDTSSGSGLAVRAAPFLERCGVFITESSPSGSELAIVNNQAFYESKAIKPTHSANFLTQLHTDNREASFTLRFAQPLRSVSFTRPALYSETNSGITYPAWRAFALDAAGNQLAFAGEALFRKGSDTVTPPEPKVYTLAAPAFDGIAALRFETDPRLGRLPFAAFASVVIDQMTLSPK